MVIGLESYNPMRLESYSTIYELRSLTTKTVIGSAMTLWVMSETEPSK
jgi:hypothetical protein